MAIKFSSVYSIVTRLFVAMVAGAGRGVGGDTPLLLIGITAGRMLGFGGGVVGKAGLFVATVGGAGRAAGGDTL